MTISAFFSLAVVLLMWVAAWNLRSVKARQSLLLLASYFFYSRWGWGFLSILILSSLLNFSIGSLLHRRLNARYLWLGILVNIALLGFFKYLPPILAATGTGSQSEFARHILMPVGISFWTFQGLSYLIDVYLEEEIDPSLLEFCLYMAFWPTVLLGPVCRLPKMLPQFRRAPAFSWDDLSAGAVGVLQGAFMKMYLAQFLASGWSRGGGVTAGFDQIASGWGGLDVWLLGIGYGFQLFFDFAGYSLMVIGIARVFGIEIAQNFDRPFLSTTPAVFWTRWHMSLSFWIRDYVFKPLSFARRERWWPHVALLVSMTLFGLWHGAKGTFIAFGMYHGLILVGHRVGQTMKPLGLRRVPGPVRSVAAWATTFGLMSIGFVLFRANTFRQARVMLAATVSPSAYQHVVLPRGLYLLTGAIAAGYFVVIGVGALLRSYRVRYIEAHTQAVRSAGTAAAVTAFDSRVVLGGLIDFVATRVWWWLAPAVVTLTLFVSWAMYEQQAAVAVTPFIYTLF